MSIPIQTQNQGAPGHGAELTFAARREWDAINRRGDLIVRHGACSVCIKVTEHDTVRSLAARVDEARRWMGATR